LTNGPKPGTLCPTSGQQGTYFETANSRDATDRYVPERRVRRLKIRNWSEFRLNIIGATLVTERVSPYSPGTSGGFANCAYSSSHPDNRFFSRFMGMIDFSGI
jgi:hypothetical protein